MIGLISIIALGFFLGMRHATDPDHVIAVTTIVARYRKISHAAVIGAFWGVGHTLTILLVGSGIILFGWVIPKRVGLSMEFSVALMLILLGVFNLTGLLLSLIHIYRAALRAMAEIFELRPYFEWRGLGFISQSALRIREPYAEWDAEQRFNVPGIRVTDPKAAQCGEVLKGVLKPAQCKLFGRECTPENPVGALMVSSEGSCAAYYNYEHRKAALVTSRCV